MYLILLLIFISLLQSALIHYQHFSPFERESSLGAVLWGAKPAPRYWAVVGLDFCTMLLTALLILGLWPTGSGLLPLERLARTLPFLGLAALLGAAAQHFVNDGVIRFPRFDLIARRWGLALLCGAAAVAVTLLAVLIAVGTDDPTIVTQWLLSLARFLIPAFLLMLIVFLARAMAFYLRVLPVVGNFLHGLSSTGLLVWLLVQFARMTFGEPPQAGLVGLEGLTLVLAAAAMITLLLAWRLPGLERHIHAVEPPPIVVSPPEKKAHEAQVTEQGAFLASDKIRVEVTRIPFSIKVSSAQGETIWELAPNGISFDLLLQKTLAIPLLYTGNTIKFKWVVGRQSLTQVTNIQVKENALAIQLTGGLRQNAEVRLSLHTHDTLHLSLSSDPHLFFNAVSVAFLTPPDAHFLGFGQRFDRFDQRGQELYFLVEEGGVGFTGIKALRPVLPFLKRLFGTRGSFPNGEKCTGFPVPFGLISREQGSTTAQALGLFWDTYQPSWIKIPDSQQPVSAPAHLTVLDEELDLYLCSGPTPFEAIRQYTALTGRSDTPPPWVLLPWKTRTGPVVEADVSEDIHRFRELDIPLAQVGVEHWQEIRGSYIYAPQWYPHMDALVSEAHANGYRIHIWHFPYMNAGAATHREGIQNGYFIRNRLGLPYQQRIFHGIATVVDYSNSQAASWHGKVVADRIYRHGFNAAMTDYAESIPPDSIFANGQSGLAMRNAYPVMYCQAMQRAAQEVWGDDYVNYPRAGYAASQRYVTAQWPGDQDTDWDEGDGLPAAVRAMLNISLCGFPIHGSDIGGWYDWFTPFTTKELYLRWAEVGAYSPLMRAHGGPIGRNREPWKFDEETIAIYRTLSEEHVRLFPYLYSLAVEAASTGAPIIRHPALIWPDRAELYAVEDAWMVGEALYVAPVIQPGQTSRVVILPPGEWWDLERNQPLSGPARITVDAPLGQTPRFLRRGHLLPRFIKPFDSFDQPVRAASKASPVPYRVGSLEDDIEVWLYPGPVTGDGNQPHGFTLFDGSELRYKDGQITSSVAKKNQVTCRIFSV